MSINDDLKVYLCDPKKNKECTVPICYGRPNLHPDWGKCMYTKDPRYSKDGKTYHYNEKTGKYEEVREC